MNSFETINSRLQLIFEVNTSEPTNGDSMTKTKSFNNVSPDATNEQLLGIAHAFASLQSHTLEAVRRNDVVLLSD
ncbi:DUF1659 domain-containing protein [Amphibacillus cookii]|uniref:DUF1659 domain-containing protein n=1 Tax=Amphibacillus cookii TaxID=767787 RepID=UPI0019570874|nr:DUF1659 domain-containing protein [Amphibacillus cookii]MBM7540361.1 hypothetical protein [Amphibacillus cookii]